MREPGLIYNFGDMKKVIEDYDKTKESSKNFEKKSRIEQKKIIKNTMIYNVPLLNGFHAHKKLEINSDNREKIYKNFGLNWWDLYYNDMVPLHTGTYKIEKKMEKMMNANYIGVILANVGSKLVIIRNTENGDTYNVKPKEYSYYNNYKQNIITAKSDGKDIIMNPVIVGYATYILVGIEDLLSGVSQITDSPLYTNFLLGSGITNPETYFNTVGLNSILNKYSFDKKYHIDIDSSASFGEFIRLLEEHWTTSVDILKIPNLEKKSNNSKKIPLKIHWIWLSKNQVDGVSKVKTSVTKYEKFMKTWKLRNPNCTLNIWTNTDPNSIALPFEGITIRPLSDIDKSIKMIPKNLQKNIHKTIHKHPNVGIRADTLRQVILFTEGGLYCDINDMCCLAPLEPYLNTLNFMAAVEPMLYCNNAIIGSAVGHEIPKRFLYFINNNCETMFKEWEDVKDASNDERDNWVVSMTGPIAFSSVIFGALDSFYNDEGDIGLEFSAIFPSKFLYSNFEVADSSVYWLVPQSLTAHYDGRTFL